MGMIFEAYRLTADQVAAIDADPAAVAPVLYGSDDDGSDGRDRGSSDGSGGVAQIELDKAWHGIHYLLTGSAWEVTPGAGEAVLGGDPVGDDTGYGPPRLIRAERVRAVADELRVITADTLRARFDPAAVLAAEIYPQVWDDEDFATYLLPNFRTLRDFYLAAAERDQAVLLVIT